MNPHHARALTLLQQRRYEPALAALQEALTNEPNDAEILARMSFTLGALNRNAEATRTAQQAVASDPEMPFAHYALANGHYFEDNYPAALTATEEAIRLDPEDADFRGFLAAIHLDQRRWEQALQAAEEGLALDPEHGRCANARAAALIGLGRAAEAHQTLREELARNPDDSSTHANLGWALLETGQRDGALAHFRDALRLDPNDERARQGILTALKSGNRIYALMLKYSLFLAKLGPRAQWGLILAGYFGSKVLTRAARANPGLAPWVLPIQVVYILFVFLTWTIEPLANLVLRFHRFGRLTLTRRETIASNWIGIALLALVLAAMTGLAVGSSWWFAAAAYFGFLLIPIGAAAKAATPRRLRIMVAYTAIMAAVGAAGLAAGALSATMSTDAEDRFEMPALVLGGVFVVGFAGVGWLSNFLTLGKR